MREIDEMALAAADDERIFAELVDNQKQFLIKCACKATKKYITTSDDDWSVTLIAFWDAVRTYKYEKGSFLKYAELIILPEITVPQK